MGKPIMLFMCLLVVTQASEASANGGCPVGKGVCVDSWNCKSGKRISSKHHNCFMPNNKRGVCCDVECTTSKGGPGKCAAAEQCDNYTRDFVLDRYTLNEAKWWKKQSRECHRVTKNTNIYCCPTDPPKQKPILKHTVITTPEKDNGFPSCQTPSNHPGRCVPLKLCNYLYYQLMFQSTERLHKLIWDSKCPSNTMHSTAVCCRNPQDPNNLVQHEKAKRLDLDKCGKITMNNKILEGTAADLGQFPWMVNIMYHVKNRHKYPTEIRKATLCSGSLIHPRYVLTAAHCKSSQNKPLCVRLGEYDLSKEKDCVEGRCAGRFIERSIEKWIAHEEYRYGAGEYDIALVKLERAAKIIPGQIYPICLPLTEQWLMTKPSQLTVSGWGMMGNKRLPDVLMYAELQLVDQERIWRNEEMICRNESVICARGAHMEGHCRGDSGGPLQKIMRLGNNRYRSVLFGVVSGGPKVCSKENNTPGVSMLVGYFLRWILDNMEI